ncbi:hypothetical protein DCAR_0830719 [Daucus carota subsp. sativus]|uniref:Uncharacterized protein n=1 Tax=Daucus carota subsp. sativus TaxID=79200 RepID=A0AAF1B9E4_DAUCS|nr:hypothetical protein DCAR_0830719 [Daucus carota subsp. sativus]
MHCIIDIWIQQTPYEMERHSHEILHLWIQRPRLLLDLIICNPFGVGDIQEKHKEKPC